MAEYLLDVTAALAFALCKLRESGGKPSPVIINEYHKLLESAKAARPQLPDGAWPARVEERAAAVTGNANGTGITYADLEARVTQILTNLRRK